MMRKRSWPRGFLLTLFASFSLGDFSLAAQRQAAGSGDSQDLTSQANDPTAKLRQLQFQDSYSPTYFGTPGQGNLLILRPVIPTDRHGFLPTVINRPTIPLVSTPNGRTGLGDITLLAVGIYPATKHLKLGIGPVFLAPTATNRYAGQGKWQLGPASAQIYTGIKGLLLGALEQNPISFAGERSRPDVNQLELQPIVVEKLGKAGYFLRFDPTLTFDWHNNGTATVPLNLGFGRTAKIGHQAFNAYIEPEGVIRNSQVVGVASEKFLLRFSFTFLFPEKQ